MTILGRYIPDGDSYLLVSKHEVTPTGQLDPPLHMLPGDLVAVAIPAVGPTMPGVTRD